MHLPELTFTKSITEKENAEVTDPLRHESRELLPQVERLQLAADGVGELSFQILWDLIDDAYRFLTYRLMPHMKAEDEVLHPVVGKLMGTADATATMSRDHLEVLRLTGELSQLRSQISISSPSIAQAKELRRILYGLHAVLKLHFAKEEEIYLPVLDNWLTLDHAGEVFEAMQEAAERARHEPSMQAAER